MKALFQDLAVKFFELFWFWVLLVIVIKVGFWCWRCYNRFIRG